MNTLPARITLLLPLLLLPAVSSAGEQPARFRVQAMLQPEPPPLTDGRFRLSSQFLRQPGSVSTRDAGRLNLSAQFTPSSATCVLKPDPLFRDRFQILP